jgi:hypothetical protein
MTAFYELPLESKLHGFLKGINSKIPRGSFLCHYPKNCILDAMKQPNQPVEDAKEKVDNYLASLEDATGEQTKNAASANKYLRFQEELALVQV